MTYFKIPALCVLALGLASCDAAMEQMSGQIRATAVEQCQQASESAGIASDLVTQVCECTADKIIEGGVAEASEIDQARIEQIIRECAANETPAPEQANG